MSLKKLMISSSVALLVSTPLMAQDKRPDPINPAKILDIVMCLKTLDNTQRELDICRRSNSDYGQVDNLLQEIQRLGYENDQLRRRLGQNYPQNQPTEFFSYAACMTYDGLKYVGYVESGSGMVQIEAEANAIKATLKKYNCNHGAKVVATEKIDTRQPQKYCIAACTDAYGTPATQYSSGARARNEVEASFLALQKVKKDYSCNFAPKITACQ